jgi:uncharacterized metal-binding protein YceD (DUF177 family)
MSASPEFSRRLALGSVGSEGRRLSLAATPEECAALAARFDIPEVRFLTAELALRPEPEGALRVTGRMRAGVVQSCVVTLEPVPQSVEEAVQLRLLPDGATPGDEDPEAPDELVAENGEVDLGEAVAEQLSLALDPYPRAPGAELPDTLDDGSATGPFAALAKLKRNQG